MIIYFIIVIIVLEFWKARDNLQKYIINEEFFHLKIQSDLALSLTTPPKIKSIVSSYIPLEVTKLLSETYFSKMHYSREI